MEGRGLPQALLAPGDPRAGGEGGAQQHLTVNPGERGRRTECPSPTQTLCKGPGLLQAMSTQTGWGLARENFKDEQVKGYDVASP